MTHWIEKYLGIRWKTGGREIATGLDCWGLLRHVYAQEFKIELNTHPVPFGSLARPETVERAELSSPKWVRTTAPLDGDGVALGKEGERLSHVGVAIVTEQGICVLHIQAGAPSVLAPLRQLQEQGWSDIQFYRHVDRSSNH